MAGRNWKKDRAQDRIDKAVDALPIKDIEIRNYVRDTSLSNLPRTVAYRVNGVHLYADILNLDAMLNITAAEGEMCHRRTLRFLNLHYRAVYRIIQRVESIFVDFHNQRLHTVFVKPYDDEKKRIHRSIATAQLIIEVLEQTGEDADHPAAEVRCGIDTGAALAVNNGRRGHREPLFLGEPANLAARRSGGGSAPGIFLTNKARKVVGFAEVDSEDNVALTPNEISTSQEIANLDVTADQVVKEWKEDLENNPIGKFEFSGHTPPFSSLDFESLSVKNSRRQDAATVYADIDGFTAYVGANIASDDTAKHVVRTLDVLRGELDAVLHGDFAGRKVRFIGDCVHGLVVEGTAQTTDAEETISNLTLCAGAMRSSFKLALERLKAKGTEASSLGLAIGFEYGPMTATRLGVRGELVRCSVSRGVLTAETEQKRCTGRETAIGSSAYKSGNAAVRVLFGDTRKRTDLDYDSAVNQLSNTGDKAARVAKAMASESLLKPVAASVAAPFVFPNKPTAPSKPAGFA